MKYNEKWLSEWVQPDISADDLLEQLTMAGLEVDGIEPVAGEFSGLVVGHVREGLPRMSGEVLLFLAAGVLAAGIASAVLGAGWTLDLIEFGATQASLLLLLMVALSVAGVHPVISIATAHGLLAPLAPDPNLMGVTYLMTWAQGVAISPLSGMHLGMQGRFGIDSRGFLRWNGSYTLAMLVLDAAALHLYESMVA